MYVMPVECQSGEPEKGGWGREVLERESGRWHAGHCFKVSYAILGTRIWQWEPKGTWNDRDGRAPRGEESRLQDGREGKRMGWAM